MPKKSDTNEMPRNVAMPVHPELWAKLAEAAKEAGLGAGPFVRNVMCKHFSLPVPEVRTRSIYESEAEKKAAQEKAAKDRKAELAAALKMFREAQAEARAAALAKAKADMDAKAKAKAEAKAATAAASK